MKTTFLCALLCSGGLLHAQGSLIAPAGSPAPVMKTLVQLEPRTPLEAGQPGVEQPYGDYLYIRQPGSYYLTSNLNKGIIITSDNVVLDLNGFSLIAGSESEPFAINFNESKGVHIHNGNIVSGTYAGAGGPATGRWVRGIEGHGAGARISDCYLEDLISVAILTPGAVVERTMVATCGRTGIEAMSVLDCLVTQAGEGAIIVPEDFAGVVQRCYAECLGEETSSLDNRHLSGIWAEKCVVTDSRGFDVGYISAVTAYTPAAIRASKVINCTGSSTNGIGLQCDTVENCDGFSGSWIGITAGLVSGSRGHSTTGTAFQWVGNADVCVGRTGSSSGAAIHCENAAFCQVSRSGGGEALDAYGMATGCTTLFGGTITSPKKFLGTP